MKQLNDILTMKIESELLIDAFVKEQAEKIKEHTGLEVVELNYDLAHGARLILSTPDMEHEIR